MALSDIKAKDEVTVNTLLKEKTLSLQDLQSQLYVADNARCLDISTFFNIEGHTVFLSNVHESNAEVVKAILKGKKVDAKLL